MAERELLRALRDYLLFRTAQGETAPAGSNPVVRYLAQSIVSLEHNTEWEPLLRTLLGERCWDISLSMDLAQISLHPLYRVKFVGRDVVQVFYSPAARRVTSSHGPYLYDWSPILQFHIDRDQQELETSFLSRPVAASTSESDQGVQQQGLAAYRRIITDKYESMEREGQMGSVLNRHSIGIITRYWHKANSHFVAQIIAFKNRDTASQR